MATGNRELCGAATGTLHGTIVDQTGNAHRVRFPSLTVSGLGRHAFSSSVAMKQDITTFLEEGNPHRRKGGLVVPFTETGLGYDSIQNGERCRHRSIIARNQRSTTGWDHRSDVSRDHQITSGCGRRSIVAWYRQSTNAWGRWSTIAQGRRNVLIWSRRSVIAHGLRLGSLEQHRLGST